MSPCRLEPEYDPELVEAGVLGAIANRPEAPDFWDERAEVYGIAEPEARAAAFDPLHARWFARLGLDRPFLGALAERPLIALGCGRWLVTRARAAREEAADLLVAPGARPTLGLAVTAASVAAPGRLWPLLRHELLHVEDMLDPRFGYDPALPAEVAGRPGERLVRERYRVLWSAWVDGRLVRAGQAPPEARRRRFEEFVRAFPRLGEAAGSHFARFFDADALTHAALLTFAVGAAGAPPVACPLCDLPAPALEAGEALRAEVRAAIARDAPGWRPAQGLCARCAELYAVRATTPA